MALSNPIKDTSYQASVYSKCWSSSFVLKPEQIFIVKSEKITELGYFVNNKRKSVKLSDLKSDEIRDVTKRYF